MNKQIIKKVVQIAKSEEAKQLGKLAIKKIKKKSRRAKTNRAVNRDIIGQRQEAGGVSYEHYLASVYPSSSLVGRPVYRQATKAIYLKNITRISLSIVNFGGLYVSINPWSIKNAWYYGTFTDASTIGSTSVGNLNNSTSFVSANFKSYRVIGAKITIVNKQSPMTATGMYQVGYLDTNADPTYANDIPATTTAFLDMPRYAEFEAPHMKELFIPCYLSERNYSSEPVGTASYPGDMVCIMFTSSLAATTNPFDIILEQDLELEPTGGTLYAVMSAQAPTSKPELHGKLDGLQDRLMGQVAYESEDEIFARIGSNYSKPNYRRATGKQVGGIY
jgi:hypothetical protein